MSKDHLKRFLLILPLISLTACLRANRETEIVKVSLEKIPEEVNGILYIATNKKIKVGIEGTDKIAEMDLGGRYILDKAELQLLVTRAKKLEKISKLKIPEVQQILDD